MAGDSINAEMFVFCNKIASDRWEPGVEVAGTETKATVPNLTEKEEYEFRVIAVNKGGLSDPSDPSEKVIAKPRNCNSVNLSMMLKCSYQH